VPSAAAKRGQSQAVPIKPINYIFLSFLSEPSRSGVIQLQQVL
jgi:hypothetical protein